MPLPISTPLPSLSDAVLWLNAETAPICTEGPVLVHFWAMSCPACKANMPALQELRDSYQPYGLQTLAVHMPRGDFDLDLERLQQTGTELGITEPCAADNTHAIGDRFQTGGVWPVYFLFGPDLRLKRHAAGGFGVRMIKVGVEQMFGIGTKS
ncbi:MAG: TlpA family protein disulfide reductase [Capsulimonadales bacterium]|nr:TlpA family protein disulfide reductase [Capsulimonadales bacterium]